MSKFFSYPGSRPSGSDDRPRVDPDAAAEALRRYHPEFYAERDRRRREDPNAVISGATVGDSVNWGGESAVVEHVERDGNRERVWMRGDKSGTYLSHWEKTGDGQAAISDARRTKD